MESSIQYVPRFRKPAVTKREQYERRREGAEQLTSRHVFIAGLGASMGHTCQAVREVMTQFGDVEAIDMPPEKRFIYVSFHSEEAASRCTQHLREIPLDIIKGGKVGVVEFAEEIEISEQGKAPEPENVSSSNIQAERVPGCRVWADWIDPEQEARILQEIDRRAWEESLKRRVQHYGFIFSYKTLMLDYATPTPALPPPLSDLAEEIQARVAETQGVHKTERDEEALTQLTVNEYLSGQGIAAHIDTANCFGPKIYIITLGAGVTMRLQLRGETASGDDDGDEASASASAWQGEGSGKRVDVWLPPRSLLLLEGDARYKWSHSIAARLNDKVDGKLLPRGRRVSLTFRHALVPGELPAVSIRPSHVETDHVFRVYDNIAVHWNHTRGKRKVHWHRVKKFLESLSKGSLMADIGSGDGKYFGLNPGVISVGCDRSLNLLKVSREPGHETFCCDAVKLPLQSDAFDATICVAVLHHLASKDRRVAAVRELLRITRPGGRVLVQAWAMEQGEESRHAFEDQDVLVPWRLQQRFLQPGQTESSPATTSLEGPCEHVEEQGDGQLLFQRYCHVYKQGELEEICSYVPGCRIVDSCWDKGNWVVEVVKIVDERLKGCNTAEEAALPAFIKRH